MVLGSDRRSEVLTRKNW